MKNHMTTTEPGFGGVCRMRALLGLVMLVSLAGCVSAPPETIQLADVVSDQSRSLEASHRALVNVYFDELEESIDRFVDLQWTPDFLSRAVNNSQVVEAVDLVKAGIDIDGDKLRAVISSSREFSAVETDIILVALNEAKVGYRAQFGQVMLDFNDAAIKQINKRRRDLKKPIRQEKVKLQNGLDEGYANLHQGQATIKAYLESVVEIVEAQDEILRKLNIIEARDKAMNAVVEASGKAADLADTLDTTADNINNSGN